jgi:hypothetical protein
MVHYILPNEMSLIMGWKKIIIGAFIRMELFGIDQGQIP